MGVISFKSVSGHVVRRSSDWEREDSSWEGVESDRRRGKGVGVQAMDIPDDASCGELRGGMGRIPRGRGSGMAHSSSSEIVRDYANWSVEALVCERAGYNSKPGSIFIWPGGYPKLR